MDSGAQDGGKIFVWGQFGESLKELDEKRLLAVAQENPNYYLAMIANDEIYDICRTIFDTGNLTADQIAAIKTINEKDALFKQVAKFLRRSGDMLSAGSTIAGEVDKDLAFLHLRKGADYEKV